MSRRLVALVLATGLVVEACGGGAAPTETFRAVIASPAAATPGGPAASPGGPVVTAVIADYDFKPATLTVAVGTTVTWTNQGPSAHTVTAVDGSFGSTPTLNPGDTFSRTFTAAGTFAYICAIHSSMKGTITVTP
jgi:plastocyanin